MTIPKLDRASRALTGRHSALWAVGALTAVALGLRWACLHQSLFGDELFLYSPSATTP